MSFLKKVDHITYACEQGSIERWAWFHIEVEGGTLINRIDDVRPDDPDSSMKIWCIDYGEFGIALIEGIDRAKKSQVTKFVERHGDHSCQHVAYDTHDLDKFLAHLKAMGGSPRVDAPTNPNEICRALAERCGGRAESLYAPAYVESLEIRDRLLEQEAVRHALEAATGADVALVGIGGTDDGCTMVRSGSLSLDEIAELRAQGAVGDVLGNYIDINGTVIPAPHDSRLIGLSIDDLRRVGSVVAVASGEEKPRAILGALRAAIVDVLIVDEANARAVIDLARGGGG